MRSSDYSDRSSYSGLSSGDWAQDTGHTGQPRRATTREWSEEKTCQRHSLVGADRFLGPIPWEA